jgi:hypothetical protein
MTPSEITNYARTSCDIDDILEARSLPANSYAVTGYGDYEEASEIIVPVKLENGTYSESLTRKESNLYKVDGVNLFIKTSMCYEYAYSQEAIIEIDNYGGYSFGEVTFK